MVRLLRLLEENQGGKENNYNSILMIIVESWEENAKVHGSDSEVLTT